VLFAAKVRCDVFKGYFVINSLLKTYKVVNINVYDNWSCVK